MDHSILISQIQALVPMDDEGTILQDASLLIRGNQIEALGPAEQLAQWVNRADEVIDGRNLLVLPGLVNTHHHMFQSLTRAMAQNDELFQWLRTLHPIWGGLRGEDVYISAKLAMAELLLSGCTTTSDHLYLFPNDVRLEDEIRAATEMGIRFHAARGAMSLGKSKGGLPPDHICEEEEAILQDMQRVIEAHHDADPYSMLRIVLAPCAPFTVTHDLMIEAAMLARSYGVSLHTHLAENDNDVQYSLEHFKMRPGEYAESLGWLGSDVWHAHCVKLDAAEIQLFARNHTGVCHCPVSNMRLASGIAPIRQMLDAKVAVGLGVDGTASNDSGNLLQETRQALLLQRVAGDPAGLSAREALTLATRGGADVLGREDIGRLAPGTAADIIAFRTDQISFAGAQHDLLAGLVFSPPPGVTHSWVNGKPRVKDGILLDVDLPLLIEKHNQCAHRLIAAG
ncbi:MAG: 8-oxoguanine deaminase [Chloroflexi bacterium]|nr:8-oxoguanine deaminase [Chloroflexota bacterium]